MRSSIICTCQLPTFNFFNSHFQRPLWRNTVRLTAKKTRFRAKKFENKFYYCPQTGLKNSVKPAMPKVYKIVTSPRINSSLPPIFENTKVNSFVLIFLKVLQCIVDSLSSVQFRRSNLSAWIYSNDAIHSKNWSLCSFLCLTQSLNQGT